MTARSIPWILLYMDICAIYQTGTTLDLECHISTVLLYQWLKVDGVVRMLFSLTVWANEE